MIERTFDYRRVRRLAGWPLVISAKVIYLIETDGKHDLGLWTLHKYKYGYRIHADMGPKCRGRKAVESAKAAFKWIYNNTVKKYIYAGIPVDNKAAHRIATHAGMRFTGENKNERFFEMVMP